MHYSRHRTYGDPLYLKPKRVDKPCAYCSGVMTLKPAIAKEQKYCSWECRDKGAITRQPFNCMGCGIEVDRKVRMDDARTHCSRECYFSVVGKVANERDALRRIGDRQRKAAYAQWHAVVGREVEALRRIARYVERPRFYRCICQGCQAQVIRRSRISNALCSTCLRRKQRQSDSYKASKRIAKAKRRVREGVRAERIDPIKVFQRDGWLCHMCGIHTPSSLRGTYQPNAPELDHVVPLALGGEHTWINVKCSCRKCNGEKGATYGAGPCSMVA
jgi:5-methylcytosine-specific restriction endonuclease McrA